MDALTPQTRSPGLGRIGPHLVAIGLTTAALWILLPLPLYAVHGDLHWGYWIYSAGATALTYFKTGFARRELAGTLAQFLSPDPMIATALFHILTNFALAAALIFLVTRSRSTMTRRVILGLAALVILWRLGHDIGRTDALIMLLGLAAALAAARERWIIAAIALSVALFVHETGIIILMPLVAIICAERGTWRNLKNWNGVAAIAILAGALPLYLVSLVPPDHVGDIARQVHAQIASHIEEHDAAIADIAVYFTLLAKQGLQTAHCEMWSDPTYLLQFSGAILLTILFGLTLRRWDRWPFLLPILAWLVGLSLIGIDAGRWTNFALFSILTLALLEEQPQPISLRGPMVFLALTGCALISVGDGPRRGVFTPMPQVDDYLQSHGMETMNSLQAIAYCDPGWRAHLGF